LFTFRVKRDLKLGGLIREIAFSPRHKRPQETAPASIGYSMDLIVEPLTINIVSEFEFEFQPVGKQHCDGQGADRDRGVSVLCDATPRVRIQTEAPKPFEDTRMMPVDHATTPIDSWATTAVMDGSSM